MIRLILPPSETKVSGGAAHFEPSLLWQEAALGSTREQVRRALEELCQDEDLAAQTLKLGVKSRAELRHNLELATSGAMPAIERYTGVLYDAIAVNALEAPARNWIDRNVYVQSALFGVVRASDAIPAYRLSASTRLPALGAPLKQLWSEAHASIGCERDSYVLDMRSKDYVALAPLAEGQGSFVNVVQRGSDGEVRALNHFNKAAKGQLVRRLATEFARAEPGISSESEFLEWSAAAGIEFTRVAENTQINLVISDADHHAKLGR